MRQNHPPGHTPTPEELAEDAEAEAWITNTLTMLPILKKEFKPGEGGVSKTPCPICGKLVHASRSSYNGHLNVRCETDDCMSWME